MPPRTIDNLGIDVSTRYAEDQKRLDASLIKEARGVGKQAEIDVTIPFNPSELDTLLETQKRNIPWAEFFAPARYAEQKKRLFTFQILPSLGTDDKQESQAEKLKALVVPFGRKEEMAYEKEENEEQRQRRRRWEEEREIEEEQREKKILLDLLDRVVHLDKYLIDINSRRAQYQRG